jgi:nicotinamidase-related amidase
VLEIDQTLLLVVDVQTKLFAAMHEKEALLRNLQVLIKGAGILGLPIIATEQYPAGLGDTLAEVAALMPDVKPIDKMSFSCWGEKRCMEAVANSGRKQVLLAGIETHVCVYQTAMDLLDGGYGVQVVTDAVSSRTPANRDAGLQKMRDGGAGLTTIEIALFELLRTAESPNFRELSRLIK